MCLFSTDGSVLAKRSGPHVNYVIESNFRNVRYRYYISEQTDSLLNFSALFYICVVLFFYKVLCDDR